VKTKKIQKWRNVNYKGSEFKFWSSLQEAKGDKDLQEDTPMRKWRKIVLLEPSSKSGSRKVSFSIGFLLPSGLAKVSSASKKIGDGLFAIRLGPGDCSFFIASNTEEVFLQRIDCIDKDEANRDSDLVNLVLY